ncbi:hypothetical protein G7047_04970 [Diaphorobacter sp. HDW4A]|uniref:hypothetical protein n=1 Tax=Diaphorobacter sp. HDW4A TaxID=2714924 RepID=UPI00140DB265|nr:hypothetical protein [Diaphorobacter sp. HDW4A]QIL79329.1 hypothetical protein G7047_04970 [Diaphorobacter sp. HDW4A]
MHAYTSIAQRLSLALLMCCGAVQPTVAQVYRSQTQAFAGPPNAQLVSFAALKKMTSIGIENFKPYRVSALLNARDQGIDALCEQIGYNGYCASDVPRVYLEIKLDSTEKRGQLYDLRGQRGAAICATVVSTPRNVNGNMNLIDFTLGACH